METYLFQYNMVSLCFKKRFHRKKNDDDDVGNRWKGTKREGKKNETKKY